MAAVWAAFGIASAARAAEPAPDALWLISTRQLSGCGPQAGDQPHYRFLGQDDAWVTADAATFLHGDDPATPTVFLIHGNRFSRQDAVDAAWGIYQFLRGQAGQRRFRFVIWSWPADRIPGRVRRDVRVKADRSELESYWLADCIRQIKPQVPVSLMGYSLGARPIVGAFRLLDGGEFCGLRLRGRVARRAPLRAVLVAAAADNTLLLPGDCDGSLLRCVDRLLVTCNPADPVLRWYRRIERGRGPDALGFTGPVCHSCLGPDSKKLEILNLSCEVGRRHETEAYWAAASLRARLAFYAFLAPPEPDGQ
jgi:hypothetical protein